MPFPVYPEPCKSYPASEKANLMPETHPSWILLALGVITCTASLVGGIYALENNDFVLLPVTALGLYSGYKIATHEKEKL